MAYITLNCKKKVFQQGVHYMTSQFGMRTLGGVTAMHNGIDVIGKYYACDYVVAFADGKVVGMLNTCSGKTPYHGNYVELDHGNNVHTVYYHMAKGTVPVKVGQTVKAGTVLGYMGTTGDSTGNHLHFGIKINGSWVDPRPYLEGTRGIAPITVTQATTASTKPTTKGNGVVSGTDRYRGENELIVYYKGLSGDGRTGTNKWGYEVQIDKNGVVLENPHYSGNTIIPKGGKVLSGHNKAGDWIYANIKKGYLVWFENGKTCVAKGTHRSVDAVNNTRWENYLVVYNKGTSTKANKWGCEVAIGKDGKAMSDPVSGVGNMAIPSGGFVLSGHNESSKWIIDNIKKGKTVTFDGRFITVK